MKAILTFHDIGAGDSPLAFPPERFAALLGELAADGIRFVDLDTILAPSCAGPAVALTFDDGYISVLHAALPVLNSVGAPAHLFMPTDYAGARSFEGRAARMLSWTELEQLSHSGVQVESHTRGHHDLRTLPDAEILEQCAGADDAIERHLGRRPRYLAYPLGRHDARVRRVIGDRYAAALTTELKPLGPALDRDRVPRIDAFYLRSRVGSRLYRSSLAPGWLALRRTLRRLRGSE